MRRRDRIATIGYNEICWAYNYELSIEGEVSFHQITSTMKIV